MGSRLSCQHEAGMGLFFRKQYYRLYKKIRVYKRVARSVSLTPDEDSYRSTDSILTMQHFKISMGQ
jgi:hypothetical protein